MVGCCYFAPVTSRFSPRRVSYFFLRRQKKVTKKKASHVRAASRFLALLAAFGTLANSLRSNSASVLIRTLLRCSARPNGGFEYPTARPLRELRPSCSFASLTLRGLGYLIPHASPLTRARHAVPLRPHPSLLTPHPSPLTPHSSLLDGATNSSYTTPVTRLADSGTVYSVVVTNRLGTVTSSNASLTVNRYSLVANASGGFYDKTECVKDHQTGLVWEGKTASGERAGTKNYTNYDSASLPQIFGGGTPTQAQLDDSTNSFGYVKNVNASALCGFADWRMPTEAELTGIVDSSQTPAIDNAWFPNTLEYGYWTSSLAGNDLVTRYIVFYDGIANLNLRSLQLHVRLVR